MNTGIIESANRNTSKRRTFDSFQVLMVDLRRGRRPPQGLKVTFRWRIAKQPRVSCTPITPRMAALLERLIGWPDINLEELRSHPDWSEVVAWGWVIGSSGELTGTGLRHARELAGGIVTEPS